MQSFQLTKKYYEWVGIYPSDKSDLDCNKCPLNSRNFSVLLYMIVMLVPLTGSFLFQSITILERTDTFTMLITLLACINNFSMNIWKCPKIYMYIEKIDEVIAKRKLKRIWKSKSIEKQCVHTKSIFTADLSNAAHTAIFADLNEKIEKNSKILHFIFVELTTIGIEVPALLVTLNNFFILNLNDESYYLSFPVMYVHCACMFEYFDKMNKVYCRSNIFYIIGFVFSFLLAPRLPFNWKTPFGYLAVSIIFMASTYTSVSSCIPTVCLAVGSGLMGISNATVITSQVTELHELSKKSQKNAKKMNLLLCEIVQNFSDAIQLSWIEQLVRILVLIN